jgi:fibronectin type 3 domain-containing protein
MNRKIGILLVGLLVVILPFAVSNGPEGPGAMELSTGDIDLPATGPSDRDAIPLGMESFFTENAGQYADPEVLFRAEGEGISASFTRDGVEYHLSRSTGSADIQLRFCGGDPVAPEGRGVLAHGVNYLIGDDPSLWVKNAASFRSVVYVDVYDGVDVMFHFRDGMLKYDVMLDAGIGPSAVVLEYRGPDGLGLDDATGDLLVDTRVGTLVDARPVFLQDGLPRGVAGDYVLLGDGRFTFRAPPGVRQDLPLVVDPGIQFATLLGGSDYDEGLMVGVDPDGNIIVGGQSNSTDLPATLGANRTTNAGFVDGFCAKFDPTGSNLLFLTYFGGSLNEFIFDMEVQDDGTIWFVGITYSVDFPTTEDAIFPDFLGGWVDAVIIQLSNDGADLLYSTYMGGSVNENLRSIELGDDGSVFVGGVANSWDLPVTPGAYCMTRTDTSWDLSSGWVVKVNSSLQSLDYCTYINGFTYDSIYGQQWYELGLDDGGRVYVAAASKDPGFPVTGGAYCTTLEPGPCDAVVFALDPTGADLVASTFVGGDGEDFPFFINVGVDGLVYVTGFTNSTDYPVTLDALQQDLMGQVDGFVTVLDSDLSHLEYSTYLGGTGMDVGASLAETPDGGTFFVFGSTLSEDMDTTPGCFDRVKRGYEPDAFIWAFNNTDHSLLYSTYLGGTGTDGASNKGIMCDASGDLLLVGATTSFDFPTTPGANRTEKGPSFDAYLVKLSPEACDVPDAPVGLEASPGDGRVELTWDPYVQNEYRVLEHVVYRATDGDLEPLTAVEWPLQDTYVDQDVVNGVVYSYAVSAVNSAGESVMSTTVEARPLAPPNETLDLSATSGDGTVRLSWSAPNYTGGSLLGYHVLRGAAPDNLTRLDSVMNNTTYVDSSATLGQIHYYAVLAYNEAGNSSQGRVIDIVALGVPSKPRNFGSNVGDGSVDLYWDRPDSDGGSTLKGYRIYRGPQPWSMSLLVDLDRSVTTYTDEPLENGRKYVYFVAAYTNAGEGTPSTPQEVVPFTVPTEPRALEAEVGDGKVTLSWTPPEDNGGRPVTGYLVLFSERDASLAHSFEVGNVTSTIHTGLTNGIEYFYAVEAINEAGAGPMSGLANVTPMGLPGAPTDFEALSDMGVVELTWTAPSDMGGAASLYYHVYRGMTSDAVDEELAVLTDASGYSDHSVLVGETYHYRVESANSIGSRGTDVASVLVTTLPGPAASFSVREGDGFVMLAWSPPDDDGASPVTGYSILRGPTEQDLVEIALVGVKAQHNDTGVTNGQVYYYSIRAVTDVGTGPAVVACEAMPLSVPFSPGALTANVKDDRVVLSWTAPTGEGMAEVTGYKVYRRTDQGSMVLIASPGNVLTYTDNDVESGKTYYYTVVADSDFGPGRISSEYKAVVEGDEEGFPYIYLLVVLVVILATAMGLVFSRRTREVDADVVAIEGTAPYIVEEAFVVLHDGKLVTHGTRLQDGEGDVSMMSGMLIAVQGIMQDGLERDGALESIKYGDNIIQIASGEHVNVVAVVYGTPDEELMEELQATVQNIEATYAGVIDRWVGDLTLLKGINEMVEPLIDRTQELTREDVARAAIGGGISLQSAADFHRGYVRLKVSAVNSSDEAIMEAGVEVHYDRDLLRLDAMEPEGIALRGDKAELGNLKAGERKTLAFLFDPQICQDTYLDGTLSFYDAKGALKHVEMKRRHANVVCPIFFTKEHANSAMLRRLVQEKLHISDARIFRYPDALRGPDMLDVAKKALGGIDIQLVREFVTEGPPFEAEVWYYGETQVKGYQIVMRIGLLEDRHVLEFFVASTDMEPLTGLLAEFRRELERAMEESLPGIPPLEPEMDTEVRYQVEARPLRIDEVLEEEG